MLTPLLKQRAWWLSVLALIVLTACSLNIAPNTQQLVGGGAPIVQLAAPHNGATYLEGVVVNVQALILNAGADIERVDIMVGDETVASLENPNQAGASAFAITQPWAAAGEGAHQVSVTAFRADGTSSEPASAQINVVGGSSSVQATEESDAGIIPTLTLPPEEPDEPEESDEEAEDRSAEEADESDEADAEAASESDEDNDNGGSSGVPMATFNVGANIRRGPSTDFNPPLGGMAAGETVELLARNPSGTWYKIQYYNAEGWVAASLVTVNGDVSTLPVDAGPPTPIPATATPIPPTAAPQPESNNNPPSSGANLVAGLLRASDDPITCNDTITINIDIANLGSEDTSRGGKFSVQDIHIDSGTVTTQTEGPIPDDIGDGETVKSADIPLTVSTYYDSKHRLVVILNPDGAIPESTTGDNRREFEYTLARGGC